MLFRKVVSVAYSSKAKIKVLYLWKILQEETDAEHGLTMAQIIARLAEYGVPAERKSVYNDIKALREFDVDVRAYQRNPVEYAIVRRDFTLDELMLMADAIQSCRAITEHQAEMLITNIKQLASNYEQEQLGRRIHVAGRVKSKSESVLRTVDRIHDALRERCKIEFTYRRIGIDGQPHVAKEGKKHCVTPVGISYEDGFYYLTAWDAAHGNMAEYRLDRMADVQMLEDERADRNSEIASYGREAGGAVTFGRFGGEEVVATFSALPDKVGILIDRFGGAAAFLEPKDGRARARVKVCKSEQFYGWIASMGKTVLIEAPASLVGEYRACLTSLLDD